jgi:DNA-binding transcriptional LysR family regulator
VDLLAHLEAYVAVADEASFSRGADRLAIAQPLLSRRIKSLEDHLGGRLFDRSKRQIALTDLGALLLPYAVDVVNRAQQLRQVARAARESAVRAVGVPADCDPAALARVIRAGTHHGTTLAVHELSPDARAAGSSDGSLAFALLRVRPENASLRVPLGLAAAPVTGGRRSRGHRVRLEDLRPRRRREPRDVRPAPPVIVLTTEDQVPYALDRWQRAAARAGLAEGVVQLATSTTTALAETHAGRALLACPEEFARRGGADWSPLADQSLHRGYDVVGARGRTEAEAVPGWLRTLLGAAVGAAGVDPVDSVDPVSVDSVDPVGPASSGGGGVVEPRAARETSARLAARG